MYSKNLQIIDCLLKSTKSTKSKKAVKNQVKSKSASLLSLLSPLPHRLQENNNGVCQG